MAWRVFGGGHARVVIFVFTCFGRRPLLRGEYMKMGLDSAASVCAEISFHTRCDHSFVYTFRIWTITIHIYPCSFTKRFLEGAKNTESICGGSACVCGRPASAKRDAERRDRRATKARYAAVARWCVHVAHRVKVHTRMCHAMHERVIGDRC